MCLAFSLLGDLGGGGDMETSFSGGGEGVDMTMALGDACMLVRTFLGCTGAPGVLERLRLLERSIVRLHTRTHHGYVGHEWGSF